MSCTIGLTGGIGSGKSAVADMLAAQGAAIVDADAISRELTGVGGLAMPALVAEFGPAIATADGALDRDAMRRLAFSDPEARRRLEGIVHPLVRQESQRRTAAALGQAPYVVLVVPLFVEGGPDYRRRVDRLVVVDCAEETQITRVMARNGLDRPAVEAIMAVQATRPERLAAADEVIQNDGSLEALAVAARSLHQRLLAFCGAQKP